MMLIVFWVLVHQMMKKTIKRAYRKRMSEHHPDKLVSKGLPEQAMEMAKKKTQDIQSAYELIKQKRGF